MLISGVGIAGPTLAYWLERYGFVPTLVECALALRTGGYVVDFWGLGYDIAEMMGLLPDIAGVGYRLRELRIVGNDGRWVAGFNAEVFRDLTGGRYITLGRSDLSRLIRDRISGSCEFIFGDSIVGLRQGDDGVHVEFERGGKRRFDFVVGADGLHFRVRSLVFGSQDRYEKDLGYRVAAFEAAGYRPRDDLVYVLHGAPGRQVGRFSLRDDRTLFLFIFADQGEPAAHGVAAQKARLRETFADDGWELPRILAALDTCDDLYFDRVSQIRMDAWSRGSVALLGDAVACVSLLAGQGTALAMVEAYVLAGELAASQGRPQEAFRRYEDRLRPFLRAKQRAAERFATALVPRTRLGLSFRNQVMRTFRIPALARIAIGRDIRDEMELPRYGP
ncbi:FAD-binding domain [Neoroseomonas lacus]|uniref:Oxidoreductase n=1 Tax=Neoroseomonas lacus TaxID=287609 RepID=A0A917NVU1_9PROT|nr:FAD-binding domain [Neoroseomonas lacus]GGJ33714.1 oxidoreductase [Neoroseomonas lacus]